MSLGPQGSNYRGATALPSSSHQSVPDFLAPPTCRDGGLPGTAPAPRDPPRHLLPVSTTPACSRPAWPHMPSLGGPCRSLPSGDWAGSPLHCTEVGSRRAFKGHWQTQAVGGPGGSSTSAACHLLLVLRHPRKDPQVSPPSTVPNLVCGCPEHRGMLTSIPGPQPERPPAPPPWS